MTLAQNKEIRPNATFYTEQDPNLEWPKYRSKEYWDYRRKWSEYPQKMIISDFPLNLDIETTNVCNLLCPHCPRTIQIKENRYVDIGTMTMDLYKKMIDEGVENGLCAVKLNYLGEPLLDKYLIERIKYAKEKGIIEVLFNTNATALTEEMSHKILEAGIDSVFFSVDSTVPEHFNQIRIGADYHKVVNNIKNFVRIKNEGNYKHVQTRVSMVVFPHNESEVEDYKKFWIPIVGMVGFTEYIEYTSSQKAFDDYNPNFVCAMPFQRLFVMYDGVCTPCCVDDARGYVTGNANTDSLKSIWHGEAYTKLRNAHISGNYRDIDICTKCYVPFAKQG